MQSFRIFRKALGCALLASVLSACIKLPPTVERDSSIPQISLQGHRFHVQTYGSEDAPVLIVLHGGPGADFRYLLNLSVLSDQYRVVFYDQLGTGLSQRVEAKDISVDTFVRDLDAVVEHFGRKRKVILLGHSWGAMLASAYLGKYPHKVSRAVLAEPGFLDADTLKDFQRDELPSFRVIAGFTKAWLGKWRVSTDGDPYARDDWFLLQVLPLMQHQNPQCQGEQTAGAEMKAWRFGSPAFQATMGKMMDDPEWAKTLNLAQGLENFEGKVLFLRGACNTEQGEAYQRKMMSKFSQKSSARLVTIEKAGHFMFNDQLEDSIAAVRQFLVEDHID